MQQTVGEMCSSEQRAVREYSPSGTAHRSAPHILAILHAETAGGPAQHVFPWLEQFAQDGRVDVVVPGPGSTADLFATIARVSTLDYLRSTYPAGPSEL